MKEYSEDLRNIIIEAWKNNIGTHQQIADQYSVSRSTITRLIRLYRETDSVISKPIYKERKPRKFDLKNADELKILIGQKPDIKLKEISAFYLKSFNIELSLSTISRQIRKLGFTRKKKLYTLPK